MASAPNNTESTLASFIWKNADDLWGDFPHTEFGKIILPFTVLRRLECVLEPTKEAVLTTYAKFKDQGLAIDDILCNVSANPFYNKSTYHLANLGGTKTKANLEDYIANFSENVRVIFEQFDFNTTINRLSKANLLLRICNNFAAIDLHPVVVPDRTMSNVYEHLIARFGAEVGTGSEDFMTPRDIVHLAATLLLEPDNELFEQKNGLIRTIYDQTCGTSGFLTDMMNYVDGFKDRYKVAPVLVPHGQELQPETHAVALGSMLLKKLESDPSRDLSQNIKLGSTLSNDLFAGQRFHYQCSNPPFGMSWAKDASAVQLEHKEKGLSGRFGAGLPKASDGSMLFLQNLISKLERPQNGGGRGAIVLSGSPLFNGGAGSGESEIRRFMLEHDYLEAIVALPTDIFFRTGIGTYIWLISNRKSEQRKGKVQLIDATGMGASMRKNEGNKRKFIDQNSINQISRIYADFEPSLVSKIFDYTDFGYRRVKVLRPLRIDIQFDDEKLALLKESKDFCKLPNDEQTVLLSSISALLNQSKDYAWFEGEFLPNLAFKKISKGLKNTLITIFGVPNPDADVVVIDNEVQMDSNLTDYENIPLSQEIDAYMAKEVLPHAPDAVIDTTYTDSKDGQVGVVGYEINFNRYFYVFEQPRHPNEIMAEIKELSAEVAQLLGGDLNMEFKQYPSYKNSGVEWLGEVPEGWESNRLKKYLIERNEKNSPIKTDNLLSVTMYQGVIPLSEKQGNGGNKPKENLENYKISYPNDIVLNSMNVIVGSVGLNKYTGLISPAYYALYNRDKNNNIKFFSYIFNNPFFQKGLFGLGNGIMYKESEDGKLNTIRLKIPMDKLNQVILPCPSISEQNQIVSFLDTETAQIDKLIAKQEQLIELLGEQRKSIISHAVTKGLNPNAPMKDSGVEWLGEVPDGWDVTYIKYLTTKITSGKTPLGGAEVYTKDGVIFLRSQNIYNDGLHLEEVSFIPHEIHEAMKSSKVKKNDILLNITGGSIGRTCLVECDIGEANVNQHVCIIRAFKEHYSKWISVFLQSNAAQSQIFYSQNGAGREGLNFSQIGNMRIPFPELDEQNKILDFINQENKKFDNLIIKQKNLIEKLKEYRSSIISHAVTGKIDVREWVA